jgi:hypothetical protein
MLPGGGFFLLFVYLSYTVNSVMITGFGPIELILLCAYSLALVIQELS